MIEVGNIVTLENDQEYLLLEELVHDAKKYVYAVRTIENDTPTDEFIIYEVISAEDGDYMKNIDSQELYDELIEEFKDVVADRILNGDFKDTFEEKDNEGEAS